MATAGENWTRVEQVVNASEAEQFSILRFVNLDKRLRC